MNTQALTKQIAVAVALVMSPTVVADEIDFNRDIRPILSDKCNYCHGPDENTREAGLRLDVRDEAEYVFESGELVDRINSDDEDMLMPPPATKLTLTAKEKKLLADWIEQGAPYQDHWAFELLPESVAVPEPADDDWSQTTIDKFVLQRMRDNQFSPTKPADPLRWYRRVTLDLTGLPPSPEQVKAFSEAVQAGGEQAYENAVDELLQSKSFGQHMAVGWLDLARYADSYGYQSDKLNTQWPYRDWVVRAFNDNLAYDKFLTWQLAGDLLENPTRDQRLATAFNRIHRLNNEGGAVFEEWRIENVADRVHTFGTAVLGLTMECSRCHDHKYDPISMRDYYSLGAFFNTIDESGVYDRTAKVPCPSMLLPTEEQQAALDQSLQELGNAEKKYQAAVAAAKTRFETWKSSYKTDETLLANLPDLRLALGFDRDFDNSIKEVYHPSVSDRGWSSMSPLVEVKDSTLARMPESIASDKAEGDPKTQPRRAISLDGERGVTTHGIEPIDRWMPFTVTVGFRETKRVPHRSLIVHHTRGTDCGYNGWDLTIIDGHVESRMARVWPGNAIGVRTVDPIPLDVWHQLSATYDGSSKAAGLKIYLNGKPLETVVLRDNVKKSANVKVDHGGEFVVGQRFRARGLAGGLIDDLRLYNRNLSEFELTAMATGDTTAEPTFEYFVSAVDKECREAFEALGTARHNWVMAEEVMDEVPIMIEDGEPRETHILARGLYDAPTSDETRVERDVFEHLPLAFPEGQPRNRLGLAKWVTDPNNPLTARVAVNHFWANFFAEPLVRTPENFGQQGELPTHPKLIDWLARDFVSNGWDVKRFCKQVVLSSTYRQDSVAGKEKIDADPTNRFLARGPAYRLTAEQIRDLALSASGLMNDKMGGPPVSPYQPGEDLWREANSMSPAYKQSVGRSLYRRSLYSVWKRTVPLPNMLAFDTSTREVCMVKRTRTNTPLQALVLLNDVQFVEASRSMAQSVMAIDGDKQRITAAFVRFASRKPDQQELTILSDLLDSEREYFKENPEAAKGFVALGDHPSSDDQNVAEVAALTTVCQAILNLDATIWKR